MLGIYAAFRYGSGEILDGLWRPFNYPDALCSIYFPNEPQVDPAILEGYAFANGKTYWVDRWFERVRLEMTWIDLDPEKAKNTTLELMVAEQVEKDAEQFGVKPSRESAVNLVAGNKKFSGIELQFQTEKGIVVQRYYLEKEAKFPRVYRLQVSGKKLKADSKAVTKFFNSFKPD